MSTTKSSNNHETTATTPSNPWYFAGLTSSFPNIKPSSTSTSTSLSISTQPTTTLSSPCPHTSNELPVPVPTPSCKILQPSTPNSLALTPSEAQASVGLGEQVLIFQYRNTIHAIDHQCPHASYPLSRGTLYDIEDFGIVLSAGVTCPRHGWAFDLHTGESDRGRYRLGVWEVDVRTGSREGEEEGDGRCADGEREGEVWVRRREKEKRRG